MRTEREYRRRPGAPERPRARKRFGQHFLEPVWADKVVRAIAPQAHEAFIEIGPGPGAITRPLAARSAALIACELDRDLAASLQAEALPGVHVLQGDFLELPVEQLAYAMAAVAPGATSWRVAGNLPYNVASPIMFRLVDLVRHGLPLTDATVMLQREVADRLLATPNSREYGLLGVLIGHRATVTRLLNLPPGAFRPAPQVQSTVVKLTFHPPHPPVTSETRLAAVTGAVFSQRRKTMGNALQAAGLTASAAAEVLSKAEVDSRRRPETLSIAELCLIADFCTQLQS